MYSPSDLFQLQALQSLAPGKDHTRFNLNIITASIHLQQESTSPPQTKTGKRQTIYAGRKI
jgi:hypothetical protein